MAVRIRKDGRIFCAAMHPEKPGDTYIDDEWHYKLSVEAKLIVCQAGGSEWFWKDNIPSNVEIEI